MAVADERVDSSITNYNSNNDRDVDGDFKRVNEIPESSKACVFQPNLFSRWKTFPLAKTCTPKRLEKIIASEK